MSANIDQSDSHKWAREEREREAC